MMFCPNCGKQLPDGSRFCDSCGAQLEAAPPVQQPTQQPIQQQYQQPYIQQATYPEPRKKMPWGLIGGAAAAVAVLVVALFVWPGVLRGSKADTYPTEREQTVQTAPAGSGSLLDLTPTPQPAAEPVPTQSAEPSTPASGGLLDLTQPAEPTTEPAAEPVIDPVTQPAPQGGGVTNNSSGDPNDLSSAGKSGLALFYSTDDDASALEFDWFLDLVLGDGAMFTKMFQNAEQISEPALLEGGWKAFMRGNGENDNDMERYLHADIQSVGESGKLTLRWNYVFDPSGGQSYQEEGSNTFSGSWDGGQLYATGAGNVKIDAFFTAGGKQYGYGTFLWPSGEIDYIALMRP